MTFSDEHEWQSAQEHINIIIQLDQCHNENKIRKMEKHREHINYIQYYKSFRKNPAYDNIIPQAAIKKHGIQLAIN